MTQGRGRRDSTRWFIAGYATLAGFFALEAATRERGTASSLAATADDQDTTRDIVLAYAVGAVAAPFLRLIPFPRIAVPRRSHRTRRLSVGTWAQSVVDAHTRA
jgi:hypothetical protein